MGRLAREAHRFGNFVDAPLAGEEDGGGENALQELVTHASIETRDALLNTIESE